MNFNRMFKNDKSVALYKKMWYNNNSFTKGFDTMDFKVTKDTMIGDILDVDFDCAPYFLEMGMHCLGCPSARGETIEQACEVHGVDPQELVDKLNDYFKNK